jgi:hypothetical protein
VTKRLNSVKLVGVKHQKTTKMSKNESKMGENQEKTNQKIQKPTKSVGSCVERMKRKITLKR